MPTEQDPWRQPKRLKGSGISNPILTNSNASVVPGKSDLVDRLGVDPLSAILPGPGGHRTVHVCFGGVPFASGPSARDPRPAAPTWCAAAVRETTHVDRCGSSSLGAAVPVLEGLAVRPRRRQTGDCDRLAPQGVSVVLDVEGSSWSTRASTGVQRDSTTVVPCCSASSHRWDA